MGIKAYLIESWQEQQGRLFPWAPVCFGLGIWIYFQLRSEPSVAMLCVIALCACGACLAARAALNGSQMLWAPLLWSLCLVAAGVAIAGARSHFVAAPVLPFRYYGPVEGRVVLIDRAASDRIRITLAEVRLGDLAPAQTPAKVRISLHGSAAPQVGDAVMTTANLSPPQPPTAPRGFDFRRHAWFQQLGAIGYSRAPVLRTGPARNTALSGLRQSLSAYLRAQLPGQVGAVAAALAVGDRAHVSQTTLTDLRASNLAHLLAISGLHMGLVAGTCFGAVRLLLSLLPIVALYINVKKCAAAAAICAAGGYLALAGGNVATERAFIMVSVMFAAILLNRRALSLNALALAAFLVLLRRPESLLSAGFQMSFSATLALVVAFSHLRFAPRGARLHPAVNWLSALVLSSLVAGLATAPFGAATFNTTAPWGFLANLLAVPAMGLLIAPAAVAAVVLAPLGASEAALAVLRIGLEHVLWVARLVAAHSGGALPVATPQPLALGLLVAAGLFLCLWQNPLRWIGLPLGAFALILWAQTRPPLVLVSADGGLVGVWSENGRALSKARGGGFAARSWLRRDGERHGDKNGTDQAIAAARWPDWHSEDRDIKIWPFESWRLVHLLGKGGLAAYQGCQRGDIVVTPHTMPAQHVPPEGCIILDAPRFKTAGSVEINAKGQITTTADQLGQRHWTR